MTDVVDVATRRRMMSGIRGKDTQPELLIRRGLYQLGFRYRLHQQNLPGCPDLVFHSFRAVVLIHGCFWHGHSCHLFKLPSTRTEFWQNKIESNKKRDHSTTIKLIEDGWRILIVWECSLKGRARRPLDIVLAEVASWLRNGIGNAELKGID